MSALVRSLAVVAAAAAILALVSDPRGGSAAPSPADEALSWVPADAALFVHVDAKAYYASKLAANVRKATDAAGGVKDLAAPDKPKEMMAKDKMAKDKMGMAKGAPAGPLEKLREFERVTGLKEDDVSTFTLFFPKLKGPGDNEAVVIAVTLSKPYDRKKVLDGLKLLELKEAKETAPGVYSVQVSGPNETITVNLTHPTRIVVLGPKTKEMPKPRSAGAAGPLAAALADAPKKAFTLGLNFAQLPDEIRGDNLPPQAEPFKPLLHADAIVATVDLGDKITLDVRAKTAGRDKAIEAEKAMGVARSLLNVAINQGVQELDKATDENLKPVKGLLATVRDAVKAAQFGNTDTEAFARLSLPGDLDLAPLVKYATAGVTTSAARSVTQNNLKQLGLALHNYHDTYNAFPAAATVGRKGKLLLSWRVAILPYVEQDALYRKFKLDEPWDSEHNKKVFDENPMPRVFMVEGVNQPADKVTHMQVFRGNGALFELARGFRIQDVTDGTSNTLMVATAKTPVPWTKPDDIEFDPKKDPRELLLFVEDVCNIAFADGSVRAVRKTVSADTLRAVITRSGGEVVGNDF